MNHLFVLYEIALQLKEKGFDAPCFAIYRDRMDDFGVTLVSNGISIYGSQSTTLYHNSNNEMICLAPLYQQVIDWFLEEKNIIVYTGATFISGKVNPFWKINIMSNGINSELSYSGFSNTMQEAKTKAIEETLKLI